MKSLKVFFLSSFVLTIGFVKGQFIDSVFASYQNDTLDFYLESQAFTYDWDAIKGITDSSFQDSIFLDIYYMPCSALQLFAPNDSLFKIPMQLSLGKKDIRVYTYLAKGTDSSCGYYEPKDNRVDTAYLKLTVLSQNEFSSLSEKLKTYPNPTSGKLSLQKDFPEPLQSLQISDAAGRNILCLEDVGEEIDLSALPRGTYFLRVETAEGFFVKRILRE